MDLIVLTILIILVVFFFGRFKSFVYLLGILEIFFKLIHFIKSEIAIKEFSVFVNKYIPTSLISIIDNYASGVFLTILTWGVIAMMCMFLFYLVQYFFFERK